MRLTQTFNPMASAIPGGSHELQLQRGSSKERSLLPSRDNIAAKSRACHGTKRMCAAVLLITFLAMVAAFILRTRGTVQPNVATRSASAALCADSPSGWKDSLDNDCIAYTRKSFCTREGKENLTSTGGNWRLGDGTLRQHADSHGVDATVACCACGGGSTSPNYLVSFSPTASPTASPTPAPSRAPSVPTAAPTNYPTGTPTTKLPTLTPTTKMPTVIPFPSCVPPHVVLFNISVCAWRMLCALSVITVTSGGGDRTTLGAGAHADTHADTHADAHHQGTDQGPFVPDSPPPSRRAPCICVLCARPVITISAPLRRQPKLSDRDWGTCGAAAHADTHADTHADAHH